MANRPGFVNKEFLWEQHISYFGRVPDFHARLGGGRLSGATSWGLGTQGDSLFELA